MMIRDRIKELRRVKASELLPSPQNWRVHPESQKDALRGVLSEIGYADALLARETAQGLMLIDGHLRAETTPDALVPVLILDVDEAEAAKLLATIDPLAALATADTSKLDALLRQVQTESQPLADMLTRLAEDHGIVPAGGGGDAPEDPGAQIDKAGELQKKWKVARGDLFVVPSKTGSGEHRLICGDSTNTEDVGRVMAGAKADAVITDPPYELRTSTGDKGCFQESYRKVTSPELQAISSSFDIDATMDAWSTLLKTVSIFVFCSNRQIARIMEKAESLDWWPTLLVWWKYNSVPFSHGTWRQDAEFVIHCKAGGAPMNGDAEKKSKVKRLPMESETEGHPTVKPLPLIKDYVDIGTNAGAVIFDGYAGSGTTLVAAEQLARLCYGMEIEPKYCAVALERLEQMGLEPRREEPAALAKSPDGPPTKVKVKAKAKKPKRSRKRCPS